MLDQTEARKLQVKFSDFHVAFAKLDPDTNELYWLVQSKDGSVDYKLTESGAEEFDKKSIAKTVIFMLLLMIFPIVTVVSSSDYKNFGVTFIFGLLTLFLFFPGLYFASTPCLNAVNERQFKRDFIRFMKYKEEEVRKEMAVPPAHPLQGDKTPHGPREPISDPHSLADLGNIPL